MGKHVIMQITHKEDGYLVEIEDLGGFLESSFSKEIAIEKIKKTFIEKIKSLSLIDINSVPSKYLQDFHFVENNK